MSTRKSKGPRIIPEAQGLFHNDENSKENVGLNVKTGSSRSPRKSALKQCCKGNLEIPTRRQRICSDTALLPPKKKVTETHLTRKKTNERNKVYKTPPVDSDGSNRAPLVDIDKNIRKSVRFISKNVLDGEENRGNKIIRQKGVKRSVDKSLTPHPRAVVPSPNISGSSEDEIFSEGVHFSENYETSLDGSKQFSPIKANLYIPNKNNVMIHQGIPVNVRRPSKKMTLKHKTEITSNKNTIESGNLDVFNAEYIREIIMYQLKNDWKYVLTRTIKIGNAEENEIRLVVVNWTIQVHEYFNLSTSVFFITVHLFDLFYEKISIPYNMCQLVILVLMWIVNKCEGNTKLLKISKLLAICNGAYTMQQFLKIERKILTFFNFDLVVPDVTVYVEFFVRNLMQTECQLLSQCIYYVLECFALNSKNPTLTPSLAAAGATSLVLGILYPDRKAWKILEGTPGYYEEEELLDVTKTMLEQLHLIQDPGYKYRQPFVKYATKERSQASVVLLRTLVAS